MAGPDPVTGEPALASGQFVLSGGKQLGGPNVPYVEAMQRWWRIRHAGDQVHMEVGPSADRPFTILSSIPDDPFSGPVFLSVGAGTYQQDPDANDEEAWFDNMNIP